MHGETDLQTNGECVVYGSVKNYFKNGSIQDQGSAVVMKSTTEQCNNSRTLGWRYIETHTTQSPSEEPFKH